MALTQVQGGMVANNAITATNIAFSANTISGNVIFTNSLSGNTLIANTVSNTSFQSGSVENYMSAQGFALGMRNRIINGHMMIDQRNVGSAVSASGSWVVDRMFSLERSGYTTLAVTAQQVTDAPSNQVNSVKISVTTGQSVSSSGNLNALDHRIEGYNFADMGFGTANAKSFTMSFWVKSSVVGTYPISFFNAGVTRAYLATYTINVANTWEYKTIVVAGDTSGSWNTTNGIGLGFQMAVSAGSNNYGTAGSWGSTYKQGVSGMPDLGSTTGATFYITGVQIEKGSVATPFENRHITTELILCQRYYEKSYNQTVKPGAANDDGGSCMVLCARNPGTPHYALRYMVSKRTSPTLTTYSYAGNAGYWVNVDTGVESTTTITRAADTGCTIYGGTANLGQFIQFQYTASSEL